VLVSKGYQKKAIKKQIEIRKTFSIVLTFISQADIFIKLLI
jgi:hypothetical protein